MTHGPPIRPSPPGRRRRTKCQRQQATRRRCRMTLQPHRARKHQTPPLSPIRLNGCHARKRRRLGSSSSRGIKTEFRRPPLPTMPHRPRSQRPTRKPRPSRRPLSNRLPSSHHPSSHRRKSLRRSSRQPGNPRRSSKPLHPTHSTVPRRRRARRQPTTKRIARVSSDAPIPQVRSNDNTKACGRDTPSGEQHRARQ